MGKNGIHFKKLTEHFGKIFPVRAAVISVTFGLISLLTVLGGVKFALPGTNASTDPREIFNALGAAFSGPVGGVVIAFLSTLSQAGTPFHFFIFFQHMMSAVWIGWAYKRLVYERYTMPYFIVVWILVMSVYSFFSYLPGLAALHVFYNKLWFQFVGGNLPLIEGAVKLYSGWMPEILFTILFSVLVIIALPEYYRRPQWGSNKNKAKKASRINFLNNLYDKYFRKNFIAVRLALWFIILFSLPLVYIGVYVHNYFSDYSLSEESYTQRELTLQMIYHFDEMSNDDIPGFLNRLNKKAKRTVMMLNAGNFLPIKGTVPSEKINDALALLSPEDIQKIEREKAGSIVDLQHGVSIGFEYFKRLDAYLLSFSIVHEYRSNLNQLTTFIVRNLFFTLFAISLLSGGILWIIVGIPLKKLTRVSSEIGKQNYDVNIDSSDMTDEIGSLAVTIEEMKNNIRDAGRELKESEEKYRELFNNANDAIYLWELNSEYDVVGCLEVNEVATKMTGYSREELMKFTPYDLNPGYKNAFVYQYLKEIVERKNSLFSAVHVKKDGTLIDVEVSSHFFELKGKKVILSIIRDISESKNAERSLRESQNRLKTLSEATFEGIGISDKGILVDSNEQLAEMLGYTRMELIGKPVVDLIAPESVETVRQSVDSDSELLYEQYAKRKDGSYFPVEIRTKRIEIDGEILRLSVVRNITERKRSEREILAAKEIAEKSNQLKSEFLAQMSHEIRSPLYTILSFFEFIKAEFDDKLSGELDSSLVSVDSAGKRIIRTIDLILNMSDVQLGTYKPSFQKIDFADDVVYMLLSEYQWSAKNKGLEFRHAINAKHTMINGDLYSISQIIGNLVDNAIKYTQEGEIFLLLEEQETKLKVSVKDTGIGISNEYLPYLFEPFSQEEQGYTRKYEGNGLGLALVKKYCEINNAVISVRSRKGEGTEFIIMFPLLEE